MDEEEEGKGGKEKRNRKWKIQIPALVWSQMQRYPDTLFNYTESLQHLASKLGSNLRS